MWYKSYCDVRYSLIYAGWCKCDVKHVSDTIIMMMSVVVSICMK